MQIIYTKTFLKDLAKVSPSKRRVQIEKFVFDELPEIKSLELSGHIEKMIGHKDLNKIRFGDYRIGLFKNNDQV